MGECCSVLQTDLTKASAPGPGGMPWMPTQQEQNDVVQKCSSFLGWGMSVNQKIKNAQANAPGNPMAVLANLPGGLSCTERISGGDLHARYANSSLFSAIDLVVGIGGEDIDDHATSMPT